MNEDTARVREALLRALERPSPLFAADSGPELIDWDHLVPRERLLEIREGRGEDFEWLADLREKIDDSLIVLRLAAQQDPKQGAHWRSAHDEIHEAFKSLENAIRGAHVSAERTRADEDAGLDPDVRPSLGYEVAPVQLPAYLQVLRDACEEALASITKCVGEDSAQRGDDDLLTRGEFAQRLRRSVRTVDRMIANGLPHIRVGIGQTASVRINWNEANSWLKSQGKHRPAKSVRKPRRDGKR